MPAAVETFFSAREVPWHGLGVVTENALTAQEAIVTAGLDWTVDKEPVERKGVKVPNKNFTVRSSDQKVLGIVSDGFQILQNVEAFQFADNLVDSGSAKYETAGALRGGRVVFMTMHVPTDIHIAGEDKHEFYLVLRMGHDGTMAVAAEITPIRVVCQNTMTIGIREAISRWSIRHTSTMQGKLIAAREALGLTFKYAEAFTAVGNQLVETKVTDDMLVKLLQDELPNRPKTEEHIDNILHLFRESPTNGYGGTAWGALNAFTEYYDHGRNTRSQEAVFTTIMDGEVASMRNRLNAQLLSI